MTAYHPLYHPHHWRGWVDWGVGAIGDMGAHLLDVTMWGLEFGYPDHGRDGVHPLQRRLVPARDHDVLRVPGAWHAGRRVKLTWYDGGLLPPKPAELGEEELNKEGGALLVGSKGTLMHETYGARPRILQKAVAARRRDAGAEAAAHPGRTPRAELGGYGEGQGPGLVAVRVTRAKLTEVMLLGVVSLRAGRKLTYDGANMRVTNDALANAFLQRERTCRLVVQVARRRQPARRASEAAEDRVVSTATRFEPGGVRGGA